MTNKFPHGTGLSCQWVPQGSLAAPISHAAFSCNSQLVYAVFFDGNIGVFDADNLKLRCRIAPSAYLFPASANRYLVYLMRTSETIQTSHGLMFQKDGNLSFLIFLSKNIGSLFSFLRSSKRSECSLNLSSTNFGLL